MDTEFDELKREFLEEARLKADEIASSFESRQADQLNRAINLAHQLKGAGGSYGFQAVSTEGAAIESGLEKLLNGGSPETEQDVSNHIRCLKDELAARLAELQPTSARRD